MNSEQEDLFFSPFFGTSAKHPRSATYRVIFLEAIVSEVSSHHALTLSVREGGGMPLV
jgi:hypothetical protein